MERDDDAATVLTRVLEDRLREAFAKFCSDIPQILASLPRGRRGDREADGGVEFVRALLEWVAAVPPRRAQGSRYLLMWYAKRLAEKTEQETPGVRAVAELLRAHLSRRELEDVHAAVRDGWDSLRIGGSVKTLASKHRRDFVESLTADQRRRFAPYLAAFLPVIALPAVPAGVAQAAGASAVGKATGAAGWLGTVAVVVGLPLCAAIGWLGVRGSAAERRPEPARDERERAPLQPPGPSPSPTPPALLVAIERASEVPIAAGGADDRVGKPARRTAWTRQVSGVTTRLTAVAWSGSRAVVVGEEGTALSSADGVSWRPALLPRTYQLHDVAFGNGVFVATGASQRTHAGRLTLVSEDGVEWNVSSEPSLHNYSRITFARGIFVAVGQSAAAWSRDGEHWTEISLETGEPLRWSGYLRDRFVAVTTSGTTLDYAGGRWRSTSAVAPVTIFDAVDVDSATVAVGQIELPGRPAVAAVWRTTDLATWTEQRAPATSYLGAVAASGWELVAVGAGVWSSVDGTSWTTELSDDQLHGFDVAWTGSMFIAVGKDGVVLTSSPRPGGS